MNTITASVPGCLPGIESFISDPARRGPRYGLATNPAAITVRGIPSWKVFLDAGLNLKAIFGPEHGFRGAAQDAVHVGDESFRGIPTYSLFGTRYRPEPWMLEGLDALVYDMQDVGCRYYTFLYTLAYIMEACAASGLPLIVLDRPNPIGGTVVEGSPIEAAAESFVGGYGLVPRYGMTVGEFALYLMGEYFPDCALEVVALRGWESRPRWQETGLPWPLPSPNIPSLSCAELYPGTCLVEGTWLSEGRGTTRPFEIIGAPFIDGERLRAALSELSLPGLVFSPVFFNPSLSKHRDSACEGVLLSVTDPDSLRSLDTGIAVVRTIRELYPTEFRWREAWENPAAFFFDSLAGGSGLRLLIDSLAPLEECLAFAHDGEDAFRKKRAKYLSYGL